MSDTNCGNYKGKRTPRPSPKPKTAHERFGILFSMFHKAFDTLEEKRALTRGHMAFLAKGNLSSRAKARAEWLNRHAA